MFYCVASNSAALRAIKAMNSKSTGVEIAEETDIWLVLLLYLCCQFWGPDGGLYQSESAIAKFDYFNGIRH